MEDAVRFFAGRFEAMGMGGAAATTAASRMVNECIAEARARGTDPLKVNRGDELVEDRQFVEPRLAAGLTVDDIRTFWNRPLVMIAGEEKMRDMLQYLVVRTVAAPGSDAARADVTAALRRYHRNNPRYGDPALWDPAAERNAGLRPADAEIYLEFSGRINAWATQTSDAAKSKLVEEHGTFNAAVRHLVAAGRI